jgi:hypothetical protein
LQVFDLQRLELRPDSRDHYITLRANVRFDPTAKCPRFDAFLLETFETRLVTEVTRRKGKG